MSALLLALAAAAQAPAPATYGAGGSEPFWSLEINGGRIHFRPADGNGDLRVAAPRRQAVRNGYRYVTRRVTILVRHVLCEDEAERRYRDTVRVTANGRAYEGCGGTLLPPATLTNTDWRIEAIGPARVDGDNYVMAFGEGRITGQAGCNRFNGSFTQRGNRLTAGPIMSTRMACPGPRMAHERAVLDLLRGPVQISYPEGDVLVLTGRGGAAVRLKRV